jgi:ribonuclease Y
MIDRERKEFECEIKEKRHFIHNAENRLNQRESNLDRKMDVIDRKDKDLIVRERKILSKEQLLSDKLLEIDKLKEEQKKNLEKVSEMTRVQAKESLVNEMRNEAEQDAIVLLQKLERETREIADKKSREILSIAIPPKIEIKFCFFNEVNI